MTRTDQSEPDDPGKPHPVRFRWLKRMTVFSLILLTGLAVLRGGWGLHATRALETEAQRYRDAGDPIDIEDFASPSVPDEGNAARLYAQAVDALSFSLRQRVMPVLRAQRGGVSCSSLETLFVAPPLPEDLFTRVRRARALPDVDWGVRYRGLDTDYFMLTPHRELAQLLYLRVLWLHHCRGEQTAALDGLDDLIAFGRSLDQMPSRASSILHHEIWDLAADALETMLPTLELAARDADAPGPGVSRTRLETLIAVFLDERALHAGRMKGLYVTRSWALESIRRAARAPEGSVFQSAQKTSLPLYRQLMLFMISPAFKLDGVRVLRCVTGYVEAARTARWPEARPWLPPRFAGSSGLEGRARALSALLMSDLSDEILAGFATDARRRMTAVALALRLYQADHGPRPGRLDALVPDYLPAVPEDPFAEAGRPLDYRPQADPPCLVSVRPAAPTSQPDGEDQPESGPIRFVLDPPPG